jgi:hypothetical protein
MKRAGLLLIAVMMSVCLGTAVTAGSAGAASPSPATNPDPLATSSEKLCVAVPIFGKKSNNPSAKGECPDGQQEISNDPANGGAIIYYLREILKLANILVGAVIILAIIISGIQYMISGGDPANVKKAKGHLMNAFTALVLYMLMVAILNFLIPGGAL